VRLYIAGIYTSNFNRDGNIYRKATVNARAHRDNVKHNLESYHYIHKGKFVGQIRADGVKVFLDSGAFSSFSLGVEVSIEAYAEFIKNNQDIIQMASVLDAIGDPVGTYHNQNRLEQLGVEVLPCFHYGEPWDLCEYYVRNYPYITIGGMVPIPNNKLEIWLDELWDRVLTDRDGISRIKIHGFGLTARKLMAKYPWYSVDSSSWVQVAANGGIVLPELPQPLAISERSPKAKDFMTHYATLPEPSKRRVDELLTYYGTTAEEMATDYRSRWAFNAFTYDRLGDLLGDDHWRKPFRATQRGLFDA
jgi:hypothetical protein